MWGTGLSVIRPSRDPVSSPSQRAVSACGGQVVYAGDVDAGGTTEAAIVGAGGGVAASVFIPPDIGVRMRRTPRASCRLSPCADLFGGGGVALHEPVQTVLTVSPTALISLLVNSSHASAVRSRPHPPPRMGTHPPPCLLRPCISRVTFVSALGELAFQHAQCSVHHLSGRRAHFQLQRRHAEHVAFRACRSLPSDCAQVTHDKEVNPDSHVRSRTAACFIALIHAWLASLAFPSLMNVSLLAFIVFFMFSVSARVRSA